MNAKSYEQNSLAIIEKAIELDETQKALLKQNWLSFLSHLESRIIKNYFKYRLYTTVGIVGGISIPAISSLSLLPDNENKILVSIIGIVTACSIGLNQTYKFNEKWRHFRLVVELARIEGETFLGKGGVYKDKKHNESFPVFAKRLEQIKKFEIKTYFESLDGPGNKKDDE
jgi:Protein of unknown function (DUF4231)